LLRQLKDGNYYLFDGAFYGYLITVEDGKPEFRARAFPETITDSHDAAVQRGVLAISSEGITFVGPPAKDGSGDTFILRDGHGRAGVSGRHPLREGRAGART
jgi:hypothetical protein